MRGERPVEPRSTEARAERTVEFSSTPASMEPRGERLCGVRSTEPRGEPYGVDALALSALLRWPVSYTHLTLPTTPYV